MLRYFFIIIALLVLCPGEAMSQKVRTKKVMERHKGFLEEYHVLKTDKNTRHGAYKKMTQGKRLLEKGSFLFGKADGKWTGFYPNGKTRYEGTFSNGKETGKWKYYHNDGRIDQIFDFDGGRVLFSDKEFSGEFQVKTGGRFVDRKMDRPPAYIGGFSSIHHFFAENIEYPSREKEKGISGTVRISFVVTSEGHARDFKVAEGLSKGLDKEALRVAEMLPQQWIPGEYKNSRVDTRIVLPVVFQLQMID